MTVWPRNSSHAPRGLARDSRRVNWLVATPARVATAAGIRPSPLLEAGRAVHRLVRARLERHAGNVPATGAHRFVHLPRCARCTALVATAGGIRTTIALGPPRGAAIWAARWLAESAAGVEILLAGGKGETLATIAAGQCHVARHVVDGSLGKRFKNVRSALLARARPPVCMGSVETRTKLARYGRGTVPAEPV